MNKDQQMKLKTLNYSNPQPHVAQAVQYQWYVVKKKSDLLMTRFLLMHHERLIRDLKILRKNPLLLHIL